MSTAEKLTAEQRREAERNARVLKAKLEEANWDRLVRSKFCLMRSGEIVAGFDTSEDADKAARLAYEDGLFSIEEVVTPPADSVVIQLPDNLEELARMASPIGDSTMEMADRGGITQDEEVDRNYEAFQAKLSQYLETHPGKFALMKDRKVVEFFDTDADAYTAGAILFKHPQEGGRFSIQEATEETLWMPPYIQLAEQ